MVIAKQVRHTALAVLAAALALADSGAQAGQSEVSQSAASEHPDSARTTGVRLQIDNDLFAARDLDRDYTGGMGITISGASARDGLLSLDPVLAGLDRLITPRLESNGTGPDVTGQNTHYARQLGLMVFTPADTLTSQLQPDDRPYASLLFVSNGRVRVDPDDRGAWSSSFTVGVLGLSLSERLHSAVHQLVGSERPRGYDHQISAGGEPTARYTLARHKLWIAHPAGTLDVKTTMQGSVGYLTETSAAISVRMGRFDTPWWTFAPELTDYMPAPVPVESGDAQRELYLFFGARIKARAYNAFLQGQFRDSELRYSTDEIEPLVAEAWIGVVTEIFDQTQVSYTLNYQTAELRDGEAARDAFWGGVQLAHSF